MELSIAEYMSQYTRGRPSRDLLRPGVTIKECSIEILEHDNRRVDNRIRTTATIRWLCCGQVQKLNLQNIINRIKRKADRCIKCKQKEGVDERTEARRTASKVRWKEHKNRRLTAAQHRQFIDDMHNLMPAVTRKPPRFKGRRL